MRTVGVLTLGCKVNTYESEFVINELKNNGYEIKDFNDVCDVYIINTCTVTNSSDSKSKKMIRQAIKRNPNACVVAMGCFIAAYMDFTCDGLDITIGNKDKSKIIELLNEYFKNKETIQLTYNNRLSLFEDMYIDDFPGRTRAFVKIQDGCDNFCSYCIIPFVRGKCRSKEHDKVVEEVTALVNNGYKDYTLLTALEPAENTYVADFALTQDERSIADYHKSNILVNFVPKDYKECGLSESATKPLQGIHFNKIFWTNK